MIERKLDIAKAGKSLEEVPGALIAFGIAVFDAGDAGEAGEDREDIIVHGSECGVYIFISFRVQHGL